LAAADVVQMAYLFSLLAFPVRALGWVLAELPRSVVGYDRVRNVLEAEGAMPFGDTRFPERSEPASLALRSVVYAHEGEEAPTIHDVTLELEAGSTTALVGPTGS